jgi:hypothetical protein
MEALVDTPVKTPPPRKPSRAKPETGFAPVTVKPIRMETLRVTLRGIAALKLNRWTEKATAMMMQTQTQDEEAQSRARSRRKVRPAREFEQEAKDKTYRTAKGWCGLPASSLRNAIIDAARTTTITMTSMKRAIFVNGQGRDFRDERELLRISTEPTTAIEYVRIGMGQTTIVARPRWDEWEIEAEIMFDADAIDADSLHNLVVRAGLLIGVGEGRPDSKKSNGTGNGRFEVIRAEHISKAKAKANGK